MDEIQTALITFQNIMKYSYDFVIACQKNLHSVTLTFYKDDFWHCAGLQYLKDIDIPRKSDKLFNDILNHKITDDYLAHSHFYKNVPNSYAKVQSRIYSLQFLEQFLDSRNVVFRYVKNRNPYSLIQADYLIKSSVNHMTAYIFIRRRKKSNEYCICSFFLATENVYQGIKAYWMKKIKKNNDTKEVIVLLDKL